MICMHLFALYLAIEHVNLQWYLFIIFVDFDILPHFILMQLNGVYIFLNEFVNVHSVNSVTLFAVRWMGDVMYFMHYIK